MVNNFTVNWIRNLASVLTVVVAGTVAAFANAPLNDNFANAELLTGTRVSVVRSNIEATKEAGEPDHAQNVGGKSVWFKWEAPSSGRVIFSTNRTETNLDTLLHLYVGGTLQTLLEGGSSNNISLTNHRSFVSFTASGGTAYYIAIDGFNDGQSVAAGEFRLDIHYTNIHHAADFDPDGKTDLAVYRPSDNTFYVFSSKDEGMVATKWGTVGDVPVIADRTGSRINYYVFRPQTGVWYGQHCCGPVLLTTTWGLSGDIPVPEAYNGDPGRTRIAVFRPSNGIWYIAAEGNTPSKFYSFGTSGDIPVPGRYSPDAVADLAVYRPSTGVWYILQRHTFIATNDTLSLVQFGQPGDKPVPGDYDGDGILDPAIFRPATGQWWYLQSTDGQQRAFQWGLADDIPTTGDFDGDGIFDFAVFRPSTGHWYIFQSNNQQVRVQHFGMTGDIPVTSNVR